MTAPAPLWSAAKPPGRKQPLASSQRGLMPVWLVRCTAGDQPPAIATSVQGSARRKLPSALASVAPVTPLPPMTPTMRAPSSTSSRPAVRAGGTVARVSATVTRTPASCSARAVR